MCDCEYRNHKGKACGSEACHCHDEERKILRAERTYMSLSFNDLTELQADEIVAAARKIYGSRQGMNIFYDTPIVDGED